MMRTECRSYDFMRDKVFVQWNAKISEKSQCKALYEKFFILLISE
jgi:hypothetical protein